MKMKERRTHPRFEIELPVTFHANQQQIPAACVDVSLGGICLLTEYTQEIPTKEVELKIGLPSYFYDITLRGKIIRKQKGIGQRVAIEFLPDQAKGFQYLKSFLENRSR